MNENYLPEKWQKIEFEDTISPAEKYSISTYGRVKSFKQFPIEGKIIKISNLKGYPRLPITQKSGKRTARYIHKLVAQAFLPKTSEDQKYVLHLDYDKTNNNVWNLKWATKKEKEAHQFSNPEYIENGIRKSTNSKLSEGHVRIIKKYMLNPDRKIRLRMLAKRFGVSEMQLHRIKTGENWGHVKVD